MDCQASQKIPCLRRVNDNDWYDIIDETILETSFDELPEHIQKDLLETFTPAYIRIFHGVATYFAKCIQFLFH